MSTLKGKNKQLTCIFAPLNAWGHVRACSAIADILQNVYKYNVIFVINRTWKGKLSSLGFVEEVYGDCGNDGQEEGSEKTDQKDGKTIIASQYWTDLVTRLGPIMKLSSFDKIRTFGLQTQEQMVNEIMSSNSEIEEIVTRVNPDLIVIDNYVLSPALVSCIQRIPWIRLRSANPLEINSVNVPPQNSGYSSTGDKDEWTKFTEEQVDSYSSLWIKFSEWFEHYASFSLPADQFMIDSPYLNLYLYPEEIDYTDLRPMPKKWYRIDALVKSTQDNFTLPEELNFSLGKIIYVSLGTFGSADLELMKTLVEILGKTSYRFIVSKGPFSDEYTLPQNMWGDASLPQTQILPLVDAVISHGGNTTLNECFYFGKPMIVLPIFGDEYDNAQRVDDTGYGIRLHPYNLNEEDLLQALDHVLTDQEIINRLNQASKRIQKSCGPVRAAELILKFSNPKRKLILFDIDGTLLSCHQASVAAFFNCLVYILETPISFENSVDLHGRTDLNLLEEILRLHNVSEGQLPDLVSKFLKLHNKYMQVELKNPSNISIACPGVRYLIKKLDQLQEHSIGLLTGNSKANAFAKLQAVDIDTSIFDTDLSAFGDRYRIREEMLPSIWDQAKALGLLFGGRNTLVIGDTPWDIKTAHDYGAQVMAVATGAFTMKQLKQFSPEFLVPDLLDYKSIMHILTTF